MEFKGRLFDVCRVLIQLRIISHFNLNEVLEKKIKVKASESDPKNFLCTEIIRVPHILRNFMDDRLSSN